jgi:glycosyltransferase involved in cell wall biosynthesis
VPELIVDAIIPALDRAETLPRLLGALPRTIVRDVYVVDNGSTDATPHLALAGGAKLLAEPRRGHGAACLRGLRHLATLEHPPDVVVFLDAELADDATELPRLIEPVRARAADLVIGSRTLGDGAFALPQRIGNHVATSLIRVIYGQRYTDLGPFRAIRWPALVAMGMQDEGYGWNVEMQVKAAKIGLRVVEVPVHRRRRAGELKISETVRESVGASYKVLYTILRHATAR